MYPDETLRTKTKGEIKYLCMESFKDFFSNVALTNEAKFDEYFKRIEEAFFKHIEDGNVELAEKMIWMIAILLKQKGRNG